MANQFVLRNISDHTLKILDEEAARNKISRNALLQIIIDNFVQNLEQANATEILLEPLQDVTKQLNTLTHVTTESQHAISKDLVTLNDSINRMIQYMYDDSYGR
ncbi:hypothetical protein AB0X56_06715 [Weissella paramesenteroides]|uniref:Ribbon-helix-helix protein CopG domain-containing protein n=1 Tax=Weissella thailandensis TaxID=89061 RepID=A0ABX9IA24_9LACO|nr:hypothetical protein [Weissella thailandensis]NKY90584.1 hypothetical protein [Weissella thailandensis]QEA57751.1 hypothetical protein FGL75_07625 [Weissella hellenica]RDS60146.1 hypothetical protein DWV05_02540 [Weissella thailandensis]GEP73758.1 hypothetical protein WTH01_00050 [Weissella thailandensis]